MKHVDETFLWNILTRHFNETFWWVILIRHLHWKIYLLKVHIFLHFCWVWPKFTFSRLSSTLMKCWSFQKVAFVRNKFINSKTLYLSCNKCNNMSQIEKTKTLCLMQVVIIFVNLYLEYQFRAQVKYNENNRSIHKIVFSFSFLSPIEMFVDLFALEFQPMQDNVGLYLEGERGL